jgi:hypothetical protein
MKLKIALLLLGLTSCIPKQAKDQMKEMQVMMADQTFQHAIAHIELYKMRHGEYPLSLKQLEYLTQMDSGIYQYVQYSRLDTGYALDIEYKIMQPFDKTQTDGRLQYPPEFWKGLGCVKSNAM